MAPGAVFVVGAGRAGRALGAALAAAGAPPLGLHGRRPLAAPGEVPRSAPYTSGAWPAAIARAGVVLVAVREADLDAVLGALAGAIAPGAIVLHLSGAADPAALAGLRAAGHPCGTFHPLVPLAGEGEGAAVLRGAWIGVDGDAAAAAAARALAVLVGAHAAEIPAGAKARYHAAAVFASNFPVVLAAEAERLLVGAGIAAADARGIVGGLLAGAAANVRARPPAGALTGPAARGDAATVAAHVAALAGDAGALSLYAALTREAVRLAAPPGGSAVLAVLRAAR